jgi:predicted ArsR family transcriptional regulator
MPIRPVLPARLFDSSRSRIVDMLRSGGMTVDDIAAQLGLSHNAVRVQLTSLERDGVVHHARTERRTTRPSYVFELTHEAQQLLSRAYVPFLAHLVGVIAQRQPPKVVASLMREAGKSLARTFRARAVQAGPLAARAAAASQILNEELGAATRSEPINGHFVIRAHGCPLAALTNEHAAVCLALESFLAELTNSRIRQCCRLEPSPQCCFEIRDIPQRVAFRRKPRTEPRGTMSRRRPGGKRD